jgi:hypothetical protein
MAGKSPTELIRDLQVEIARLTERQTLFQTLLDVADLVAIRERVSVVESQLAELRKREEENDRKRWQLTFLFIGSLLTLAIQVTILFLKK